MKTNKTISLFDFSRFEKIEDIIFLDEPILTHYKRNGKDFLLYLVDTDKKNDIYLLMEVTEDTIYKYLTKKISLFEVITKNDNILYLIKQDFNGIIVNVDITQSDTIPEDYLPIKNSFLEFDPLEESYYYKFIKNLESQFHFNNLKSSAFYIKFSSNNTKYSDTIGFNELANNLLINVSTSFKSFLKADFVSEFQRIQTNSNILQATFNKISPDLDFRMVDLKCASFEVGLAVDKVMMKSSFQDRHIREWAINVGYKYKKIVLDENYNDKIVEVIINSYCEEDRKKIFEPIFKITENPNFKFQVKNNKSSKYSTIRIKDKSVIEKIIPHKIDIPELDNKEYEIIQTITVREKNNLSKSIKLDDNTLFNSTDTTEFTLKNKDFEKFGYHLDFTISLPYNISTEKALIILSTQYDGIAFRKTVDTGKIDDVIKKITTSIFEYISNKPE